MRTETMDHDSQPILSLLGRNSSYLGSSSKNVIQKSQINDLDIGKKRLSILDQISPKDRQRLKARYAREFNLFGYDYDADTNIASCAIPADDGTFCC